MKNIDNILIVGSGRWSRELLKVVTKSFPPAVNISFLISRRVAEFMQFLRESSLINRVVVVDSMPQASAGNNCIAFIANSAFEHENSIEEALHNGFHVVVEKPFTVATEKTLRVITLGEILGKRIFSTNTLKFASYLEDFKELLPKELVISRIDILWTDLISEMRYGESKKYDPRVPIVIDIIPHIVCMMEFFCEFESADIVSVKVSRGGAEVDLCLRFAQIETRIRLGRNCLKRNRILTVWNQDCPLELDFSIEPGKVISLGKESIDPEWHAKDKPLACMIKATMNYFEKNISDPRLDVKSALRGNRIIDMVMPIYNQQQSEYLSFALANLQANSEDPDLKYALKERAQNSKD